MREDFVTDGITNGRTYGRTDGCAYRCTDGCTHRYTGGCAHCCAYCCAQGLHLLAHSHAHCCTNRFIDSSTHGLAENSHGCSFCSTHAQRSVR